MDETTAPGTVVKVTPDETPIPTFVDAGSSDATPAPVEAVANPVENLRKGPSGARTALAIIAIATSTALAGGGSGTDERRKFTPGPSRVSIRHGASGQGGSNGQGGADNSVPPEEECPTPVNATPPKFVQKGKETTVEGGYGALFSLPIAPDTIIFTYNATLGANAAAKGQLRLIDGGKICILETGKNSKENSTVEVKGEASVSIRTTGKYSVSISHKAPQNPGEQPQIESIKIRALEGETIIEQEGRDELISLRAGDTEGKIAGQEAEISLDIERLNDAILGGNCAIISQGPGVPDSHGQSGDSSDTTVLIFACTVGIGALARRQGQKAKEKESKAKVKSPKLPVNHFSGKGQKQA